MTDSDPHDQVIITFEFEGVIYKAVGFIPPGEQYYLIGKEMLAITKERHGGAISDGVDITALENYLLQNPREFRMWRLVTGEVDPKNPARIFYYQFDGDKWNKLSEFNTSRWEAYYLVVCICRDSVRDVGVELC